MTIRTDENIRKAYAEPSKRTLLIKKLRTELPGLSPSTQRIITEVIEFLEGEEGDFRKSRTGMKL